MEIVKITNDIFEKVSTEQIKLSDLESNLAKLQNYNDTLEILEYPINSTDPVKSAIDLYNEPIIALKEQNAVKINELQELINYLKKL